MVLLVVMEGRRVLMADLWVPYGPGLVDHDYSLTLAGELGISPVEAAGYIALLVARALRLQNDIGLVDDLTDRAIEKACYWTGERGALVKAFCRAGVLQGVRDDDTHPLTICPEIWKLLADRILRNRSKWRRDKRNQRNA